MLQDKLYRLDPKAADGARMAWDVPRGDLPLGGAFGGMGTPTPPNSNAHVGPHSLQVAPDESIWITLALGNQLARFDPKDDSWSIEQLEHGFYPHTLRFDPRGRIWYTIAASNHLGMFDPATGEHREMRLPAASFQQSVRQILQADDPLDRKDRGMLHRVAQFTHVSRPAVTLEGEQRLGREANRRQLVDPANSFNKVWSEQADIFGPFAKRRHVQPGLDQPVVQAPPRATWSKLRSADSPSFSRISPAMT